MPVAFLLLTLTVVCAVAPVAINMAALQLKAQAVEMDAIQRELKAEVREVEARIANLNSAAHLKEQVEKMGMESASAFSYLEAHGDGSTQMASTGATSIGGANAETDGQAADDARGQTGVAWVDPAGGAPTNGSDSSKNR